MSAAATPIRCYLQHSVTPTFKLLRNIVRLVRRYCNNCFLNLSWINWSAQSCQSRRNSSRRPPCDFYFRCIAFLASNISPEPQSPRVPPNSTWPLQEVLRVRPALAQLRTPELPGPKNAIWGPALELAIENQLIDEY